MSMLDLSFAVERKTKSENVCQIMWPQLYVSGLKQVFAIILLCFNYILSAPYRMITMNKVLFHVFQGPLHERSQAVARRILGDDMAFDFDMLIYKVRTSLALHSLQTF